LLSEADFQFEFKPPAHLPNPMLSMQNVSFGYPSSESSSLPPTVIVQNISRSVLAGQRIGILGANGQGKSTVVKTIARSLQAVAGEITEGKGLNIGYFAQQELDVLQPADNPLDHMIALSKRLTQNGLLTGQATREQDLRSFLGQFNFSGDMVKQTVGSMSGGEKARLVLCMLVWQRPNLLLLDEPTNHLDLATREALSVALNEFEGTVMLVSHDRALLRAVCDEFWMVSRGGISPFDGDLDDYQRFLLDEAKRLKAMAATPASTTQAVVKPIEKMASAKPSLPSLKHLQKELAQVESKMQSLEAQRDALHALLASANLSVSDLATNGKALKQIEEKLPALETQWLALTEQLDHSVVAK
jgi:ATP-binding cassette subfamily F protein 3